MQDKLAITEVVQNWALWRDAGDWERFRTVWHPGGRMMATWFQGSYEEFIKVSQEGYDKGVRIMHMLGGMNIDIKGKRAIAQTKMTISQRAPVEGVICDVVCSGRFYDFLEKRKGISRSRQPPARLGTKELTVIRTAAASRAPAIGRVQKIWKLPSERMRACRNDVSTIGPRMKARSSGASSNPPRRRK